MTAVTETYPYRASLRWAIGLILFFGGFSLVMIYFAATNDRGLILNGVVKMSASGATIFYLVLAAPTGLMTIFVLLTALRPGGELTIDGEQLAVPPSGLSRSNKTIRFAEVTGVEQREVSGTHLLILSGEDARVVINNRMLRDNEQFFEVSELILARLEDARARC